MIKIDGVDPKMIANNLIPFEPTHPGEVLKNDIESFMQKNGFVKIEDTVYDTAGDQFWVKNEFIIYLLKFTRYIL